MWQVSNVQLFLCQLGAVNADDHKSLGGQYQVQGFPTIKIFGPVSYTHLTLPTKA